jgi:type 1 fimbriae regulatory protein FimB/type 1 fimbriae regulatory protein FimE
VTFVTVFFHDFGAKPEDFQNEFAQGYLIKRVGERAGFPFKVHAHMLRHACGYALTNAGHDTRAIQDWLGHRAIQHTARYTELSQERFKDFWRS